MTLTEVLIASSLAALILLSLAVATGNIFDAYDTGKGRITVTRDAATCLDQIMHTIRQAKAASLPRTHALLLTDFKDVDRLYEWSGTPGDPLTFKVGLAAPLDLLPDVSDFSITILNENVDEETTTSNSSQLLYFDSYPVLEYWLLRELWDGRKLGAIFRLPMDASVDAIQLTDVGLVLGCRSFHTEDLRISLYECYSEDYPRPCGSPVASIVIDNLEIPSATWDGDAGMWYLYWNTYSLGSSFWIYPNRFYILLLETVGPGAACYARVRETMSGSGPDNGQMYLQSDDGGATWWPDPGTPEMSSHDMPIDLTGTTFYPSVQNVSREAEVEVTLSTVRNGETLTFTRREGLRGGVK
jgi:hypothetical protein